MADDMIRKIALGMGCFASARLWADKCFDELSDDEWEQLARAALSSITAPEIEALCERLERIHEHHGVGGTALAESATALRQQQAVIVRLQDELNRR